MIACNILNSELKKCVNTWHQRVFEKAKSCIDDCFDPINISTDKNGVKVPSDVKMKQVLMKIDKQINAIDPIERAFCEGRFQRDWGIVPKPEHAETVSDDGHDDGLYCDDVNAAVSKYQANMVLEVATYALEAAMNSVIAVALAILLHYLDTNNIETRAACADETAMAKYIQAKAKAKALAVDRFDGYQKAFFARYYAGKIESTYEDYLEKYKDLVDTTFYADTLRVKKTVKYPPFRRFVSLAAVFRSDFYCCQYYMEEEEQDPDTLVYGFYMLNELFAGVIYALEQAVACNALACAQVLRNWWERNYSLVKGVFSEMGVPEVDPSLMKKYRKVAVEYCFIGYPYLATEFDRLYQDEIEDHIEATLKLMIGKPEKARHLMKQTYRVGQADLDLDMRLGEYGYGYNVLEAVHCCPPGSKSLRLIDEFVDLLNLFLPNDIYAFTEEPDTMSDFETDWSTAK